MKTEVCYCLLCFTRAEASAVPKIFGFVEFITALALLVVLYTIIDIRYKFRLAIVPGGLYLMTFLLIIVIGVETLLTELWYAEGWWLPKTAVLNRPLWEACLAPFS